jgi:hypothetical protein
MTTQEGTEGWVPEACTLPTADQPLRVAEFDGLFATALRGVHRSAPTRLRLVLDASAEARARELANRESQCCSLFTFRFQLAGAGAVGIEVAVPAAHVGVLDALAAQAQSTRGGPT